MAGARGILALLLVALGVACERPLPREQLAERIAALERPNLVLLVVDTLRADWLTPYGYPVDTSPQLARWAESGVVFERNRSQSSWTKMSMASLLTSLWPRSHGIREADDGLADAAVTLAEALRDAGYATYGVQTNGWLDQSFGFQQGFDRYLFPMGKGAARLPRAMIWPHAEKVYQEAERVIDAHDPEKPFFLYLHFMDVHEYAAPSHFERRERSARGDYEAGIRWVDHVLGQVREKLDDSGYLDTTVLVLTSDHGEAFGENGRHGHARNVLTPVVWVPLVFRFPFPVAALRVAEQVRNVDIAPTLLELAGAPVPDSFEGRSLLALMTGEGDDVARTSYAALGRPLFQDASVQLSLTDGDWTYARNVEPDPDRSEFLFDRRVDPLENVNLIEHESEQAEQMRERLDAYLAGGNADVREEGVRIDPGIADRLRAMGYLQ